MILCLTKVLVFAVKAGVQSLEGDSTRSVLVFRLLIIQAYVPFALLTRSIFRSFIGILEVGWYSMIYSFCLYLPIIYSLSLWA